MAQGLRPVTSVVVQVIKVAQSLRPATLVEAGGKRALLVDLERAEANVRRAIAVRRAAALLRAALAVRVGRGAAAAVPPAAVEEDPLVEEDLLEVAVADEQEQEKETRETAMKADEC